MKEIPQELFTELVYDPDIPGCLRWVEVRPASGVRGVYWGAGVWYSCIRANGVPHRFSSKGRQAVEDWAKAKREELHGQYANHT